ncbi:uncharacterized protein LOC115886779 [Sitophilus oryzae]|uniref:Uncharacterized protein LOC115886779 n=1 Tax=Sitophilus oryzae TaxID=7048 RepID=A0A6J2YDF1_SITOR|nr:uncharacterized protein LOC115886779 [Sitophilus oryzae]XP_030761924.1 uncharacterized protein LOC115886779 [Sitophilus oryzae]
MLSTSDIRFALLFIQLFSLYRETSSLKSMVIKVPEAVKSGDTVTLKCEYDLENVALYSIKWYWNDEEFYRYIPKESPPFKAFPVKLVNVDLSKSGANAVTLRGVHRQLTGDYKCEVSADGPLFHTDILVARMIVAELPHDDPIMSLRDTKVEIGKKIQVECFSASSDPEANLTWFINNKEAKDNNDFITIHPTKVEKDAMLELKSARSKIEILTNKSHFIQGVMTVRCVGSVYNLWHGSVENYIRDDSPKLAQVLGSTLSQSQLDPIFEHHGNNATWMKRVSNLNLFLCLMFSISRIVLR